MKRAEYLALAGALEAAEGMARQAGCDESVANAYRAIAIEALGLMEAATAGCSDDRWVGARREIKDVETERARALISAADTIGVVNLKLETDEWGTWVAVVELWGDRVPE